MPTITLDNNAGIILSNANLDVDRLDENVKRQAKLVKLESKKNSKARRKSASTYGGWKRKHTILIHSKIL